MSSRAEEAAARAIVDAIRAAFPEEVAHIDPALSRDGYVEAHHIWVERFSQCTTDAIRRGDQSKAASHLKLLSALLNRGDEATRRCIDVAYVESLMWDIKDEKIKHAGWNLIPEDLKSLYLAMWGEKTFMRGAK